VLLDVTAVRSDNRQLPVAAGNQAFHELPVLRRVLVGPVRIDDLGVDGDGEPAPSSS
jgi:hypothetical protein